MRAQEVVSQTLAKHCLAKKRPTKLGKHTPTIVNALTEVENEWDDNLDDDEKLKLNLLCATDVSYLCSNSQGGGMG